MKCTTEIKDFYLIPFLENIISWKPLKHLLTNVQFIIFSDFALKCAAYFQRHISVLEKVKSYYIDLSYKNYSSQIY